MSKVDDYVAVVEEKKPQSLVFDQFGETAVVNLDGSCTFVAQNIPKDYIMKLVDWLNENYK